MRALSRQFGIAGLALAMATAPAFAQTGGGAGGGSSGGASSGAASSGTASRAGGASSVGSSSAGSTSPGRAVNPVTGTAGTAGTTAAGTRPVPSLDNSQLQNGSTGAGTGAATGTSAGTAGAGAMTDNGSAAGRTGPAGSATASQPGANPQNSDQFGSPSTTDNDALRDTNTNNNATSQPAITDPTGTTGGTASGGGVRRGQTAATGGSTGSSGSGDGTGLTGENRAAYGATMKDCMSVWDPTTHMTKEQWKSACERTSTRP